MSIPKMAKAMGYIDDDLVTGAVEYKRTKKKNSWMKWGAMAACLCLVVALFPLINSMVNTETPDNPIVSDAPVHFYLDGNLYSYHGEIAQELPAGYEHIGEIKNVGDAFTGNDFEGNADGKIYMNKSISDTAYFSWVEWNEEIDGPAPFLKLEITE